MTSMTQECFPSAQAGGLAATVWMGIAQLLLSGFRVVQQLILECTFEDGSEIAASAEVGSKIAEWDQMF